MRRALVILALTVWSALCIEAVGGLVISHAAPRPPDDPQSAFHRVIGRHIPPHEPCALCGMTGGMWLVAHGQREQAARENRFAVVAYVTAWALAVSSIPCVLAWRHQLTSSDNDRTHKSLAD